ncbi:EamA family transporter [Hymenobacter sp. BT683]|uniref:EamA family transporter n=1 Tax=Hymenobacter jeongseonensis TaxID=2791027 RepID=A0ABS0ID56_9BACT|nr:EamA family transporter [Hymenobacter jeongseonensis]MBF9236279.1 EamA family transporter [Hymenobacter jeongseonensis]
MWVFFALLAAMVSASVVTLSKAGIKNVPPSLAFAVQAVLIILVAWGTVLWEGLLPDIGKIERRSWVFLIAAGVLTAASSLLSFRALSIGDASRVSPLTNVALVFSVVLAAVFLKEKLTWQVMLGAALMASGAIVIAMAKPSEKTDTGKKNGRPESGTTIYESKPTARV